MIFQQGSSVAPFMLDESSANEPTIFQVFFRVGEKEYQYYISLKEEIVFESLLWRTLGGKKTGLIFERDVVGSFAELSSNIKGATLLPCWKIIGCRFFSSAWISSVAYTWW